MVVLFGSFSHHSEKKKIKRKLRKTVEGNKFCGLVRPCGHERDRDVMMPHFGPILQISLSFSYTFCLQIKQKNSKYVEKRQIILICFTSKQHFIYTEWATAWNEKLITEMRPRFDHRITKNWALTKSTTDIFNYCLGHIASASHKKLIIYANFNFVSLLDVIYFWRNCDRVTN